jgi:hypothetical protein
VIVLRKDECFLASVESIRVDDRTVDATRSTKGQELGLGLSRKAKNASALRRLNPPTPADASSAETPRQEAPFEPAPIGNAEGHEAAEELTDEISESTSDEA